MSWQETTAGFFERPITLSEVGLLTPIAADRPLPREPFQIHCVAELTALKSSDLVIQALRDAWLALRLLKSPDIATTFGDGKKYYRVPSSEELGAWLNQTTVVSPPGTTVQTATREVYTRIEYLPVLYILPQPTDNGTFKGSVVLFISHWRTEASGCFMMLHQIFDFASDLLNGTSTREALLNHKPGNEIALLTPSIEEICMPNNQQTSAEARSRVDKYFALYESFLPCVTLPLQNDITTPYSHVKLHHRIYTPTSTLNLVQACRSQTISVTAAIHAAYLEAIWQITSPSSEHLNWASIVPAQVRTHLPPTSPYRNQGCWSAAQMMQIVSPPDQPFLTRAQDLHRQYRIASNSTTFMHEDMRALSERAANPPPDLPTTQPGVPFISSLGVLDRDLLSVEHDGITVREVSVYADNVGPGIVLTVWTFAAKLNLQISWNVAYHGDDQVEEILDIIERTLVSELGIEFGVEQVKLLLL